MSLIVTVANPSRHPHNVSESSREVTKDAQDVSPINCTSPTNPIIEARFERLEVRFECHTNILIEHDVKLKEHDAQWAKQDSILEKSYAIVESLKITHCGHGRGQPMASQLRTISGGTKMM